MSMSFRSKSPQRVLDELGEQAQRYRSFHFEAVDNILDFAYLKTLLPELIKSEADYRLFYEVKANLSREQLRLMAQAGVSSIQPGIESLSSHVLKLMRKGVRAIQNVNLLRWSLYYDIDVSWNFLWGFPGETEDDYAEQAAVIPHLIHLPPPWTANRIWLERFSPLFNGLDTAQIKNRAPERSYRYVYPHNVNLEEIAYFFEYEFQEKLSDDAYVDVCRAIEDWRKAWHSDVTPTLTYWSSPNFVQICDQRQPEQIDTYTFEGPLADLYLACSNKPTTAEAVRSKLNLSLSVETVQEIFGKLQDRGLMFLDGELALSLALPAVKSR
jgi:ribosomal peptide maturation radical SAM protein 1